MSDKDILQKVLENTEVIKKNTSKLEEKNQKLQEQLSKVEEKMRKEIILITVILKIQVVE